MSPAAFALAGGGLALLGTVAGLAWLRAEGRALRRRLGQVAATLAGPAAASEESAGVESVFRVQQKRSPLAQWFRERIETRYPLLDAPSAAAKAVGAGVLGAAAFWGALLVVKAAGEVWTIPACAAAGVAAAPYSLAWMQARRMTEFIRDFPEIVDQIVRLSAAGVPPLEALAAVAEDAPPTVAPALREVHDGLAAGLDSDAALSAVAKRLRIPEFTMFAAVIRLQRRAGGGVSAAFSNLAATLRERRQTALKARAATAQTRLTLLVLAGLPVVVLIGQKFTAPQSVDMLFGTEQGTSLLRWGVGLIVVGLLVARSLAARSVE